MPWVCQAIAALLGAVPIYVALAYGGPQLSAEIFGLHRIASLVVIFVMLVTHPLWVEYSRWWASGQRDKIVIAFQRVLAVSTTAVLTFFIAVGFGYDEISKLIRQDLQLCGYVLAGAWAALQAYRYLCTILLLAVGSYALICWAHVAVLFVLCLQTGVARDQDVNSIYAQLVLLELVLLVVHLPSVWKTLRRPEAP